MTTRIQPMIEEAPLLARVTEMAAQIAPRLEPEPIILGLFKGGFVFTADLMRALSRHGVRPRMDFMVLSSYGKGMESSGEVRVKLDCSEDLNGRQVLLLDDILDSGNTLAFAVAHLRARGAREVLTAVLLDKPERRQVAFHADYVGFTIPNAFVVGYGIDYAERFRELPYVAVVTQTDGP